MRGKRELEGYGPSPLSSRERGKNKKVEFSKFDKFSDLTQLAKALADY